MVRSSGAGDVPYRRNSHPLCLTHPVRILPGPGIDADDVSLVDKQGHEDLISVVQLGRVASAAVSDRVAIIETIND